jgi:hypothetical protein
MLDDGIAGQAFGPEHRDFVLRWRLGPIAAPKQVLRKSSINASRREASSTSQSTRAAR